MTSSRQVTNPIGQQVVSIDVQLACRSSDVETHKGRMSCKALGIGVSLTCRPLDVDWHKGRISCMALGIGSVTLCPWPSGSGGLYAEQARVKDRRSEVSGA